MKNQKNQNNINRVKIIHILHAVGGVDVSLRLILANIDSEKFESIVIHGDSDKNEPFLNDKNIPRIFLKKRIFFFRKEFFKIILSLIK